MDDKFLQDFLKTGLFDIGDSDERLKWLQESISDLKKKFEADYSLLHKFSLVALDPNISDSEPVMIETEKIITDHWKALRGKYAEMPRNIIRGVILNALYSVGIADPFAARIIYLTALNFYPYAKLLGEKKLVVDMLKDLGELAEIDAVKEWSLKEEEESFKLGTLKSGSLKFVTAKLDKASFKEMWDEAFTNTPAGHGPQHGLQNSDYRNHFSTKTSDAIVSSFNTALEGFGKSISTIDIETSINKFFTEFKKVLDANLKTKFSSLRAVERRSKLLWWKETLYSTSQKRSYRGLDKYLLPVLMGSDLNHQVPEITPISVDYLLKETLFLLTDKQEIPIKFSDFLSQISSENLKQVVKSCLSDSTEREGRISVTDFITLLVNGRLESNEFKYRTGIDENEVITLSDLSVIVLHDLLIQRLTAG